MADNNQIKYLEGLVAAGGGNGEWAKNQLKKMGATTTAPASPSSSSPAQSPGTVTTMAGDVAGGGTYSEDGKWYTVGDTAYAVGSPITGGTGGTVDDAYSALLGQSFKQSTDAIKAQTQAGVNTLESTKGNVNTAYKNNAQQAYILNEKSQRQMPQQLSALGINGGTAERTAMSSNLAYQNTLNEGRTARDQSLADIENSIANLKATGDMSIANSASTYYEQLAQALQDSLDRQQKQSQYDAETAYNTEQDNYAKNLDRANVLAQSGDFSGYTALGYTPAQIKSLQDTYNSQIQMAQQKATSSRSSGSSGSGTTKYTATQFDTALEALKNGVESDNVVKILTGFSGMTLDELKQAYGLSTEEEESSSADRWQNEMVTLANQGYTQDQIASIMNNRQSTMNRILSFNGRG